MAEIYTLDGDELTTGLQGCNTCDQAILGAQVWADRLGTAVHLVDDDGEWIVHPAETVGSGEYARQVREPADRMENPDSL